MHPMQKDFDDWNERKKRIDSKNMAYIEFHEGDVWWIYIGLNIGSEENGKEPYFTRPVIILKKYDKDLLFVIPLSTQLKDNPYYLQCSIFIDDKESLQSALISQPKSISVRRLDRKLGYIRYDTLIEIRGILARSLVE
jgi:mRNA interferase MazF